MTVFKHPKGKTFRYDFYWQGERYTGNTLQTNRRDAELAEAEVKKQLRLQAAGLAPSQSITGPRFQDWAEVYLEHVLTRRKDIKRPDRITDLLRVVLRFWGARPSAEEKGKFAAVAGEPYHDLRLSDPIQDPMWLLKFEDWMTGKVVGKARRPISGQTKNQYRSVLSQLYAVALQPAFRQRTGVTMNPFVGVPRDAGGARTSTITVDELRRWLQHASYHVRLAVAIAALAPKLRLGNVLALKWREHLDRELRYITVAQHKTAGSTGRPLVVPIGEQLRTILLDALRRRRGSRYVVTYRGRHVKSIRGGVRAAAVAAGLPWGRFDREGITFHTIRHTMATMLAELAELDGAASLSESVRKEVMGHERLETTQRYTHIRPTIEKSVLERLSNVTPIADLVTQRWTRVSRKGDVGKSTGTPDLGARKSLAKPRVSRARSKRSKVAS